jgi:hypothetical protein
MIENPPMNWGYWPSVTIPATTSSTWLPTLDPTRPRVRARVSACLVAPVADRGTPNEHERPTGAQLVRDKYSTHCELSAERERMPRALRVTGRSGAGVTDRAVVTTPPRTRTGRPLVRMIPGDVQRPGAHNTHSITRTTERTNQTANNPV